MCRRQALQCSCDSCVCQPESDARSFFEEFGPLRKPRRLSLTSSISCQEVSSYLGTRSRDHFYAIILTDPAAAPPPLPPTVGDLTLRLT